MEGRIHVVTKPPGEKLLDMMVLADSIIAIGGGSVIDTAKIIAHVNGKKTLVAVPTTGAGASETSHAVYWANGRKHTIGTPMPVTCYQKDWAIPDCPLTDLRCHAHESYDSVNSTTESGEWVDLALTENEPVLAGIYAGKAIEITGTNTNHAMSYPLTGIYGIPHTTALSILRKWEKAPNLDYDIPRLVAEALSYSQIHDNTTFIATEDSVRKWYERALYQ